MNSKDSTERTYDTNIYWIRAHISKQELANRFIIGDKLIEDEKEHHITEIAWLRYLAKRGLSRDQAQRYMRASRRFSLEQRQRIIDLWLPWKAVELLSRTGITHEHIEQLLSLLTEKPSIDRCVMLLHSVLYPSEEVTSTETASATSTKEIAQTFLGYLEDTTRAMRHYFEKACEPAKE